MQPPAAVPGATRPQRDEQRQKMILRRVVFRPVGRAGPVVQQVAGARLGERLGGPVVERRDPVGRRRIGGTATEFRQVVGFTYIVRRVRLSIAQSGEYGV